MDLVGAMTKARDERRFELEAAEANLAKHQQAFEEAQARASTSLGNLETWEQHDRRARFEQNQVEATTATVQQCRLNLQCAETALASAQREQKVETLNAACNDFRKQVVPQAFERIRTLREELRVELQALDAQQTAEAVRCEQLREAGVIREPHSVMATYLRDALESAPGTCLANFGGPWAGRALVYGSIERLLFAGPQFVPDGRGASMRHEQLIMLTPASERVQVVEAPFVPEPYQDGTIEISALDEEGNSVRVTVAIFTDGSRRVTQAMRDRARTISEGSFAAADQRAARALLNLPDVLPTQPENTYSVQFSQSNGGQSAA